MAKQSILRPTVRTLRSCVYEFFFRSRKKRLLQLLERLILLRGRLQKVQEEEPLDAIVYFFDVISEWDDNDRVKRAITELEQCSFSYGVLSALEKLQEHIRACGRHPHGWNRTKEGEAITADDVYLGDIYGLFTCSVSRWREEIDAPPYLGEYNAYDVVSLQAQDFMENHIPEMICLIDQIEQHLSQQ